MYVYTKWRVDLYIDFFHLYSNHMDGCCIDEICVYMCGCSRPSNPRWIHERLVFTRCKFTIVSGLFCCHWKLSLNHKQVNTENMWWCFWHFMLVTSHMNLCQACLKACLLNQLHCELSVKPRFDLYHFRDVEFCWSMLILIQHSHRSMAKIWGNQWNFEHFDMFRVIQEL